MQPQWMTELEIYDRWMVETALQTERGSGLACGRDYDLLLLRGDTVISYTADVAGQTDNLSQIGEMDDALLARIVSFLHEPTHELAAAVLPNEQRVAVVLPAAGDVGGEGLVLLPHADKATVGRVLDRAFDRETCWLTDPPTSCGTKASACEVALEHLLRSGLRLLDRHMGSARMLPVRDRRNMSLYLCALHDLLRTFWDGAPPADRLRPFPIAYPFHGTFCPAHAAWMALCFAVGLKRLLPPERYPSRSVADHERLLPMIEIAAGNRTRLPDEWRECARMAEHLGMFFDVRRTRHSILVRLCPLVPASEREFAVRAALADELWKNPPEKRPLLP